MKATYKILYTLSALVFFSCTKDNEFIKEELEKALPAIEVTSLGLNNQYGPFTSSQTIQATFGGSLTQSEPGTIAYAWYTSGNSPRLVDSVYFNHWTVTASTATKNSAVSTDFVDTTYPNTVAFTGKLNLPLSALTPGTYTLRVYVRNTQQTTSSIAVTNFVTVR